MEHVLWLAPDPALDRSHLAEVFGGACADFFRISPVASLDEARVVAAAGPVDAIIFNWTASRSPHWFIESFFQDPVLALVPFVVVTKRFAQADIDYLLEYQHKQNIYQTPDLVATSQRLRDAVVWYRNTANPAVKYRERIRRLFALLYAGTLADARAFLENHLDKRATEIDRLFYSALIHKTGKAFDAAIGDLARGLKLTQKASKLEPRFLHLIGNVAFRRRDFPKAIQFLEAAHRFSPRNLRRRLILAQCLQEQGRSADALAHYEAIHASCPAYPGLHSRLFDLKCEMATAPQQILSLESIVAGMPDRGLVAAYKKKGAKVKDPKIRRALLDVVIREFSRRANKRIDAKDFYGALMVYQHVERLVPLGDRIRQASLAYCLARTYYHAAEYDKAREHMDAALTYAPQPSERFEKLDILIARAVAPRDKAS